MHISKIHIENFKCFEGTFDLNLNQGLNIIVGDNEAGKSTILEAINLALSGWIYGKYISSELTQALFNSKVISKYLQSLKTDEKELPPTITIELYFNIEDESLKGLFTGTLNSSHKPACGLQFKISFDERYKKEYQILLDSGEPVASLPIEFYQFSWSSFARDDRITPKIIPIKAAPIDSSANTGKNGSDIYIARIIRDSLSDEIKVKASLAHRKMVDAFSIDEAIGDINKELSQRQVSDKEVKLSVDVSTKNAWETSLTTYLDDIPFQNIGRGEQSVVKTKLALSHKKAEQASIILFEEPENHLSHSKLNSLINFVNTNHDDKQLVISTHSSYVANKLGLDSLILINKDLSNDKRSTVKLKNLEISTHNFFKKLAGYDTLRMVLCKKAILVEGPSDELIVQRAYKDQYGKLPIEGEVDVISVGTSFLRFLEIAKKISKKVIVVTDNDGDYANKITKKYKDYKDSKLIKICASDDEQNYTLEPQLVKANKDDLDLLRKILELDKSKYPDGKDIGNYMEEHKTTCALKIFDAQESISYPDYIVEAITNEK